MQLIHRDNLLQKLIERKDNGAVKIITGIRRCGKSFLLSHLYTDYLLSIGIDREHIISIDFDMRSNSILRNPDALLEYLSSKIQSGNYYIFLDEIQLVLDFEEVVNEINHFDNVDVYITGSNSKFLSKDIITEFRGRGDEIHVRPLSFSELYKFKKGDKYELWDEYCMYGGMPALVVKNTEDQKVEYLQMLIEEVYLKDVIERNNLKEIDLLDRIMNSLFSSIGSLTNPNRTCISLNANGYKDTDNTTVAKYISALEDSYIFERADRFDVKGKEYFSTPSKYYAADVGLRNARLNFRQHELTHISENLIYNELRNRGYTVDVGVIGYRENTKYKQLEIDFIANRGNKRYYVQSAFSCSDETKRIQEIRPFLKVNDSFKKILVTSDHTCPWTDDNGILTINIIDFMLDPNSLDI